MGPGGFGQGAGQGPHLNPGLMGSRCVVPALSWLLHSCVPPRSLGRNWPCGPRMLAASPGAQSHPVPSPGHTASGQNGLC